MRRIALWTVTAVLALVPTSGLGWGFPGHQTVGAIADIILNRDNSELYERLQDILGGKTLREVAIYPDCFGQDGVRQKLEGGASDLDPYAGQRP